MKVLLIYPNLTHQENISLGLASISAVLKANSHEVALYDFTWQSMRGLLSFIRQYKPQLIGFTVQSGNYLFSLKTADFIKKNFDIPIVFGGVHATIASLDVLQNKSVDYVCVGESENAILQLMQLMNKEISKDDVVGIGYKNQNNEAIVSQQAAPLIENLDSLPFADRELYDYQKYINGSDGAIDMMTSRGCPFSCLYCVNHVYHKLYPKGKRIRYRSVDNILAEIELISKKYKFSIINFQDDAFTFNKDFVINFCREYRKRFSYKFTCNSRVESIDAEVCAALKAAGCISLNLGIETGNEHIRKATLNRHMSNDRIVQAFSCAKDKGLKTYSFNMIGVPFETAETIDDTIQLNQKVQPDFVQVSIFQPYPGTKLRELCIDNGWLGDYAEVPFSHKSRSIVNYPQLSAKTINKFYKTFRYKIYRKANFKKAILCWMLDSNYNAFLRLRSMIPDCVKKAMYKVSRS